MKNDMEHLQIISTKYNVGMSGTNSSISAIIDGVEFCIPIAEDNIHYQEIMRRVEAGTLTIADAE